MAELGNGHGAGHRAAGMASRRTERHPHFVGGEDNPRAQELSFMTRNPERVNAFMDAPVFDRVGRTCGSLWATGRWIGCLAIQPFHAVRPPGSPRPRHLGAHLEEMNPDSPSLDALRGLSIGCTAFLLEQKS